MCPELGGCPEYLDIVGVNYYYNNQWLCESNRTLGWNDETMHPNWRPLNELLRDIYRRYNRPLVISETSHPHEDRPVWMTQIARECDIAIENGIPLWGLCWYPIIDRPDWDHLDLWHHSGIWDRADCGQSPYLRVLHEPTADAFVAAQKITKVM